MYKIYVVAFSETNIFDKIWLFIINISIKFCERFLKLSKNAWFYLNIYCWNHNFKLETQMEISRWINILRVDVSNLAKNGLFELFVFH